jgi:succinate dehydrogenase / fumarate reductase iron-sulfur subunit
MAIKVTLRVFRYRPNQEAHFDTFEVKVPEAANVLDAIEQAWVQDNNLMFRHACHHASCGTCAVRINGREKLPCIAPVREYANKVITVEPLRNFPLVGDLVVDVEGFFQKQEASGLVITRPVEDTLQGKPVEHVQGLDPLSSPTVAYNRFENCIECGICLSVCPTMAADYKFFGPAGLAAIQRELAKTNDPEKRARLLELADSEQGVWRCHSAWECTEACPQSVYPAEAIMDLRKQVTRQHFKNLFGR